MNDGDRFRLRWLRRRAVVVKPVRADKGVLSFWLKLMTFAFVFLLLKCLNQHSYLFLLLLVTTFGLWMILHLKLKGMRKLDG